MHIRRDLFRIESGGREADGTPIEPEAQTVQHVFQGTADAQHVFRGTAEAAMAGPGVNSTGLKGTIPLEIVANSTAQQVARSVSALCANCRRFDRHSWLKMISVAEGAGGTESERHSINAIRGEILAAMPESEDHVGGDGEYDVEHMMKSMGMCHALREFYKGKDGVDPGIIGVAPRSGCPQEVCDAVGKPQGLYVPKDLDAEQAGQQNYDAVMNRAAGKIL